MYLAVIYYEKDIETEKPIIFVEYDPIQFKQALVDEFATTNDLPRAFDRVCDRLKKQTQYAKDV